MKYIFAAGVIAVSVAVSPAALAEQGRLQSMESEMILIPGGEFLMGSSEDEVREYKKKFGKREMYSRYRFEDEAPKRKVFVKSFQIDRHEVTNREYLRFVMATGHHPPPNWQGGMYVGGKDEFPVLFVSYDDAVAYARWAGKRLPTAMEWEKASRGTDGRVFPWGNSFDPYKASTADSDLASILGALCSVNSANRVEIAPGDVSPYGVHDMGGNVREWTSSSPEGNPSLKILKGASWVDLHVNARAAHVEYVPYNALSHIIGFRCVKDTGDTRAL
jgi:formylglycine-generating enzyme required for sulfatase activity